jgi:hypothetical protein
MNAQLHVLFGAGQVGRPLAQLLLDAGKRVLPKRIEAPYPREVGRAWKDELVKLLKETEK